MSEPKFSMGDLREKLAEAEKSHSITWGAFEKFRQDTHAREAKLVAALAEAHHKFCYERTSRPFPQDAISNFLRRIEALLAEGEK